jgi:hypothetical protein
VRCFFGLIFVAVLAVAGAGEKPLEWDAGGEAVSMGEDRQFADMSNRIRAILSESNTSPSLQATVLADLIAALLARFEGRRIFLGNPLRLRDRPLCEGIPAAEKTGSRAEGQAWD